MLLPSMSNQSPLVLAFGDSLVAGYGLPAVDGFAAQLERRLRERHPGARVVNAGVSGDTTADALRRVPGVCPGWTGGWTSRSSSWDPTTSSGVSRRR